MEKSYAKHRVDPSSKNKKTEKNEANISKYPLTRTHSNESEDFVTISYGSDSVSFTKKTTVNPLKRSKIHGKRDLGGDELAVPIGSRNIFDPLPPLPGNSLERPPQFPPRMYGQSAPSVPQRIQTKPDVTPPELPPRKTKLPPDPPPRMSRKHPPVDSDAPPPVPPPRNRSRVPSPIPIEAPVVLDSVSSSGKLDKPTELVDGGQSSHVEERNEELSSPGVYGTPMSSFDVNLREELNSSIALLQREESLVDSDQSEGYRTPPPASPLPTNKETSLSISESSTTLPHSQPFFTPLDQSVREGSSLTESSPQHAHPTSNEPPDSVINKDTEDTNNRSDSSLQDGQEGVSGQGTITAEESRIMKEASHRENSEEKEDGINVRRKGIVCDSPFTTNKEENPYEFDQTPVSDDSPACKKISTGSMLSDMSDTSLVITKAVSEAGSVGSFCIEDQQEVNEDTEDTPTLKTQDMPEVEIETNSLTNHAPISESHSNEHSPVHNEMMESISDAEDQVGVVHQGKFLETMRRSKTDTWTMMSPKHTRSKEVG